MSTLDTSCGEIASGSSGAVSVGEHGGNLSVNNNYCEDVYTTTSLSLNSDDCIVANTETGIMNEDLDSMRCIICHAAMTEPFSHECGATGREEVEDLSLPVVEGSISSTQIAALVGEGGTGNDVTGAATEEEVPTEKANELEPATSSYICDHCGDTFSFLQNLRRHQYKHSDEKKFKCNTCGELFKWASGLEYHIDTKHSLKEYLCNICNKQFKNRVTLANHKKMAGACQKKSREA